MKKLVTLILALILVVSFVSAKGNEDIPGAVKAAETKEMIQDTKSNMSQDQEMIQEEEMIKNKKMIRAHNQTEEGNQTQERVRDFVGLENAISRVKNENAKMVLERNLEKFKEKVQKRINMLENITVEEINNKTGAMMIKAKEQVKFLGFIKGTAVKRFSVNAEGAVEEHAPWYRFLYSEVKEPMVGNDRDEHGCIGSAGYQWDEEKQKCVRPWEEESEDMDDESEDNESKEVEIGEKE